MPFVSNGFYKFSRAEDGAVERNFIRSGNALVKSGQVVEFDCVPGYTLQGPSNVRCWYGNFTASTLPECAAGKTTKRTNRSGISFLKVNFSFVRSSSLSAAARSQRTLPERVQGGPDDSERIHGKFPVRPWIYQISWPGGGMHLGGSQPEKADLQIQEGPRCAAFHGRWRYNQRR